MNNLVKYFGECFSSSAILEKSLADDEFKTPVVLITGGTGLVGNAIHSIVKESPDLEEFVFVYCSSGDYDLTDLGSTREMFQNIKPEYVIHLAACVGGLYKNMSKKVDMFEKNLIMNYNIVKCAHEFGVKRLIACLSTCIFPNYVQYPINETMLHEGPPHFSNDAYAYAKRMLEVHCRTYREMYNSDFICIIPTNIYGHHDNFSLEDGHVLPALINKCHIAKMSGEDFIVRGSGAPIRQFIYSEDLAKLVLKILFSNNQVDNIILSCSEYDEVSIAEVARYIAKQFNYENRIQFDESYSDGQYKKTASNFRITQMFPDFEFTPIEEGIEKTVKWFLENPDLIRR